MLECVFFLFYYSKNKSPKNDSDENCVQITFKAMFGCPFKVHYTNSIIEFVRNGASFVFS